MEKGEGQTDDSDTEHGGCTPAECPGNHNDGDTSSDGENMELAGTPTDNPQGTSEGAGSTMEDADVDDSDTEHGGCTPAECPGNHNDGDTSSDGENMELAGTPTDNPQGTTEGAGSTAEDAEDKDVDEESADECLFDDITDEEEGAGIGDISQLGAGAVAVKFQTVQQESYQLVAKDTTALAHHIIGCCQQPEGEITSAPQQHQGKQLHPASAGDVDQTSQAQLPTTTPWVVPNTPSLQVPTTAAQIPVSTTAAQIPVSTTTPCVVPNTTSLQVPATAALTPASTSLLPRIPGSVVSEMQSSGLPEVPVTGDSRVVAQYNLIQVRQEFGDVTVPGARNVNIGGTQTIGEPQTIPEEEEKPLTAAQKIRNPDNCADIVVPCGTNAVCLNKRQNDSCVCNPGLTGDGQTCSEENECLTGSNNCDVNADCTDVVGSYTCACKPGFNGDGRTCTDNNECSTPNVCHENANCTNTLGSYTCHCNHMYEGDGVICNLEKIRGQTCTQASDCIRSNFTCSSGLCDCDVGYSYDGNSNTCVIRCNNYGSEFSHQSTTYCVTGYNNAVINVNTYTECRQYCLTTSSFTCRTFELWNGACYLSSAVKTEVPDSKWAAWTGCKYYQRHCA